jgi:hypothetical protein
MYRLDGLTAVPMSNTIGVDTYYSQRMVMNWRGNDEWYLAALGPTPQFPFPPTFSDIREMNGTTGGTLSVLGTWPRHPGSDLPEYEPGDLAILPEPAAAVLVLPAWTLTRRRSAPGATALREPLRSGAHACGRC